MGIPLRSLMFSATSLLLAGCDLTVPYVTTVPIPEQGRLDVAVMTVDERPEVDSGKEPATFVGIMRGRVGIPLDRLTQDGRPLADDFSETLVNSLVQRGYRTQALSTQPARDPSAALAGLRQAAAARLILLELREWRSDTYTDTTVSYDVTLHVYDATGHELAAKTDAHAEDTSGGSFFNPIHRSDDIVTQFYAHKISGWFADPGLQAALAAPLPDVRGQPQ